MEPRGQVGTPTGTGGRGVISVPEAGAVFSQPGAPAEGAAREERTCRTCRHFRPIYSAYAIWDPVEQAYVCPLVGFRCPKHFLPNVIMPPSSVKTDCPDWEPR